MRKFKILFLTLFTTLLFNAVIFANSSDLIIEYVPHDELPEEIRLEIESRVNSEDYPEKYTEYPKVWEVDVEGNTKEVLSSKECKKLKLTNDGFNYIFYGYDSDYENKNWYYQSLGTYRLTNNSNSPVQGSYEQQSTKTSTGYVEGNDSGSAKVNAFVTEVEAEMGISVGYSRTYSAGKSYGADFTVPPNSTVYATNYAVSVNSNGTWKYKKYSSGGSWLGYYYESAGGNVISKDDVSISIN